MFMLESHLSADQNRVVEQVQAAADAVGVNLFLTGGGMRDMLGGFQIRDLDFSVEGNALKVVRTLEEAGAQITAVDENRRSADLVFAGGVTAQIAMSRKERYAKSGAKPQVTPATIQEDLRGRDFTVNAMALSLNRASRGLLLDPTNGLADLGHKELRSTYSYLFYDDPARLLRLVRLRARLAFTVEERTRVQFDNARAAHLEDLIPPRTLWDELKRISEEPSPVEVVRALDEEGLLGLYSPALSGAKLNLPVLTKLEKVERLVESANTTAGPKLGPFLYALTGKLTPKEKSGLIKAAEIPKAEIEAWRNLEPRARKLEHVLKSPNLRKPSGVYEILAAAPGDELVFLLCHSEHRVVQERARNYLQKYLPAMLEVPRAEWDALEGQPGTPKYNRSRHALVAARLDVRPKKPVEPELAPVVPVPPVDIAAVRGRGRWGA
jgi:tRNA nucleotidyltransferase (CCA-adding enzyme)